MYFASRCASRSWRLASSVLKDLTHTALQPNVVTYTSAVDACEARLAKGGLERMMLRHTCARGKAPLYSGLTGMVIYLAVKILGTIVTQIVMIPLKETMTIGSSFSPL